MDLVTEFRVDVSPSTLDELHTKLRLTRWPEPATVDSWTQGVPLAYLQKLCNYWANDYDWAQRQEHLNSFPQFRTEIGELGIHFIHYRSPHDDAHPVILTHGWPGSVVEFLEVIRPLADPVAFGGSAKDAFHVVCPSLPGYGWSDRPSGSGWDVSRIAGAWAQLMTRLGYHRFAAQGGDWGAAVTRSLAADYPERLSGIHLNMVSVSRPRELGDDDLTDSERAALARFKQHQRCGCGYSEEQATRPQTLGYALTDSPAGQCAWIVEKFQEWADCGDDPVGVLGVDRILDNVMAYWVTATAASSGRLYWENARRPAWGPTSVPMGAAIFAKEIYRPSRRWASPHFLDIRRWSEIPVGGHFAAFEQPEVFVEELRAFGREVRS